MFYIYLKIENRSKSLIGVSFKVGRFNRIPEKLQTCL